MDSRLALSSLAFITGLGVVFALLGFYSTDFHVVNRTATLIVGAVVIVAAAGAWFKVFLRRPGA